MKNARERFTSTPLPENADWHLFCQDALRWIPEFRAEREDSHACRLRASSTRSARRMRTGFGVQGGADKTKRYKLLSPRGERRAGSQRVAPPENEKSTPNGVLRSLWRVDKKDAYSISAM